MKGTLKMNNYETIFLLNIKLSEEDQKKILDKVTKCIINYGKITSIKNIGKRNLAYEIRKQKQAYYYEIDFEAKAQCIPELQQLYRFTDEVLKFITIKNNE